MQITFNVRELVKGLDELRDRAIPGAVRRAMRRSLNSANVAMAREVSSDMGLKVGTVKREQKTSLLTTGEGELVGQLSVSGKRIPLIAFGARGPEPSRGRGRVTANTGRGRKSYPGTFITTVGAGRHRGVFERVGTSTRRSRGGWSMNLPIAEKRGASLPHVFGKKIPVAIARFQEQFVKELQHEVRFAIQKAASS